MMLASPASFAFLTALLLPCATLTCAQQPVHQIRNISALFAYLEQQGFAEQPGHAEIVDHIDLRASLDIIEEIFYAAPDYHRVVKYPTRLVLRGNCNGSPLHSPQLRVPDLRFVPPLSDLKPKQCVIVLDREVEFLPGNPHAWLDNIYFRVQRTKAQQQRSITMVQLSSTKAWITNATFETDEGPALALHSAFDAKIHVEDSIFRGFDSTLPPSPATPEASLPATGPPPPPSSPQEATRICEERLSDQGGRPEECYDDQGSLNGCYPASDYPASDYPESTIVDAPSFASTSPAARLDEHSVIAPAPSSLTVHTPVSPQSAPTPATPVATRTSSVPGHIVAFGKPAIALLQYGSSLVLRNSILQGTGSGTDRMMAAIHISEVCEAKDATSPWTGRNTPSAVMVSGGGDVSGGLGVRGGSYRVLVSKDTAESGEVYADQVFDVYNVEEGTITHPKPLSAERPFGHAILLKADENHLKEIAAVAPSPSQAAELAYADLSPGSSSRPSALVIGGISFAIASFVLFACAFTAQWLKTGRSAAKNKLHTSPDNFEAARKGDSRETAPADTAKSMPLSARPGAVSNAIEVSLPTFRNQPLATTANERLTHVTASRQPPRSHQPSQGWKPSPHEYPQRRKWAPAMEPLVEATYDTLDDMTLPGQIMVTPPCAGASQEERMEYLGHQIDVMMGRTICQGLVLKEGLSNRLQGGQAVVQFASHKFNKQEYAAKFFMSSVSFKQEVTQYTDASSPIHALLPPVHTIVDNSDGKFLDGNGYPVPCCIVMERGESLDLWIKRSKNGLDVYTCMQIIQHVSDCLVELHEAGYVHRDLKPGNIMWLPSTNRWTLIDFGCAAKEGEDARLAFSVMYAAPEVAKACYREKRKVMEVSSAVDVWAVGIIALELFSGRPAFDPLMGKDTVVRQLCGEEPLPWEAPERAQSLLKRAGHHKGPVLSLLRSDPAERLNIRAFLRECSNLIAPEIEVTG